MPRQWHLDMEYPPALFESLWGSESQALLRALFRHLDQEQKPVLSVLPRGISPAGAAIAASLYFLPGIPDPPRPHSRIALFPGTKFIGLIKEISLPVIPLVRATQIARVARRGCLEPNAPIEKLQKLKPANARAAVHFHWIWRCRKTWMLYGQPQHQDIGPRDHFGIHDQYGAAIEFIVDDDLAVHQGTSGSFDLLIYCPYYHPWDSGDWQHPARRAVAALERFPADRKLVVVRSPYGYWAQKISEELRIPGLSFIITAKKSENTPPRFEIVDQCLSGAECRELFGELTRLAERATSDVQRGISLLRNRLKKALVSLAPVSANESSAEVIEELRAAANSLGLTSASPVPAFIEKVCQWIANPIGPTKITSIIAVADEQSEVWVTSEGDRQTAVDALAKAERRCEVKAIDYRLTGFTNIDSKKIVLTRIDRASDLDWISYLSPADTVIMTAWEATVRIPMVLKAWERSERWRSQARELGISSAKVPSDEYDPVLHFADFILEYGRRTTPGAPVPQPEGETPFTWWDDPERQDSFAPVLKRDEVVSDGNGVACYELHFEGATGMFLREDASVQVFRETSDTPNDAVFLTETGKLRVGDVVILPRDSERGTILDMLGDHLERTEQFRTDAQRVRLWKDNVRAGFQAFKGNFNDLTVNLMIHGGLADPATVRSWIIGSTMAPLRENNIRALIDILKISEPTLQDLVVSVKKMRSIARTLGRFLNQWVLGARSDTAVAKKLRQDLEESGVDMEEVLGSVELKKVVWRSNEAIKVAPHQVRKVFGLGK